MPAPNSTREALVLAAAAAFETVGFEQTNTNQIARQAGFAPQTFYRHFKDKLAIFLAVYDQWTLAELEVIAAAGSADDLVRQTLAHHGTTRLFRRTLRDLSVRSPDVATAREASRRRQLDAVRRRAPAFADLPVAAQIGTLLAFERLCDAVVEGEFERLGAEPDAAIDLLAGIAGAFDDHRSVAS
jgi:AcrR family transcriptional regulator